MWSTYEGMILVRTARAVMFQSHYWEAPLWLPTSQMIIEPDGDTTYVVKVKDWLTSKKGLLEFTAYSEAQIKAIAGAT